ncbi:GntR family transcriptional regulator [Acetobacterium tundrae]|uniref:GntR family transcriptional regulator n=1 Tax=Acetobacterium tundrae TaxID=132932 RepID=UPI001A9A7571|nr:GntR family transcriptional regulator [Acetobacterium tundrae]
MKADEKLPSTRGLSEFLSVSRNVVMEAYEQLWAEGYLYAKEGSGTYVSEGICFERKETVSPDNETQSDDLEACLKEKFGDDVSVTGTRSGMHLVASFESIVFDAELRKALNEKQIVVTTLKDYFVNDNGNSGQAKIAGDQALVLGYGNTDLRAIEDGVAGIAQVVKAFKLKTV